MLPRNAATGQKRKPSFAKINQLAPDTSGHNLLLKVLSSKVVLEKNRIDGTKIRVAECVVGDETGIITLTARNDQIDVVQPGNTIVVRNGKVDMFEDKFMRLAVDKWGTIKLSTEPATFEPLASKDLSSTEYELVERV